MAGDISKTIAVSTGGLKTVIIGCNMGVECPVHLASDTVEPLVEPQISFLG